MYGNCAHFPRLRHPSLNRLHEEIVPLTHSPLEPGGSHGVESPCALCGLPVGRSRNRLETEDGPRVFCCPGCKAVYQILIHTPGLVPEAFLDAPAYRAAVAAGLIPDPKTGTLPPESSEEEMATGEELVIALDGMWCSACAWLIESVLRRLKGVQSARAHFLSDAVHVRYLPQLIQPGRILSSISRLGYGARLPAEDSAADRDGANPLIRLGITGILAMNVMMISWALYFGFFQDIGNDGVRFLSYLLWLLATPAVFYGGYPIFTKAFQGLRHGAVGMETLIAAGCLSAYGYSTVQMIRANPHVYFDTASMLVALVLFGKHIEIRTRERITEGVKGLYRLSGGKARVDVNGSMRWVRADHVQVGEDCDVKDGERIPVDGIILRGEGSVDEACLTGESIPKAKGVGDDVLAGSELVSGGIRIRALRSGRSTTLQHMIRIMTEALTRKNPAELLADRVTRWMVPGVLVLASLTGTWLRLTGTPTEEALLRALTVLLITCPCALGIATPLAKVAAVWAARSSGVIIRDPSAIEKLSSIQVLVLDKTGTVTEGRFRLRSILTIGASPEEALQLLGGLELHSSHVLAREILSQCERAGLRINPATDLTIAPGLGLRGQIDGVSVMAGNVRYIEANGFSITDPFRSALESIAREGLTSVLLARAGDVCALFALGDTIRTDAPALLTWLRAHAIQAHLVSGDSLAATECVASQLGLDASSAQALPLDKVAHVERCQALGLTVAMLGDGINDGAALARADVGMAFGSAADLLHETADIAVLSGRLESVPELLELCRRSTRIIKQNLFAAFFYNALGIPLAVAGWLNPLIAVLAMVASSLTVIANTLRIKGR
ncbi:MAG: heavy metal translocating P-type ATPase metal-binding domain-containing protein [Syntrophobacteraceae bacterium]